MEHGPEIDKLTRLRIELEEEYKPLNLEDLSEEEILLLKYRRGQKLIDKTTGKEVTILAGKRTTYKVPSP